MDIETASSLSETIGDPTIERVEARGSTRVDRERLMTPAALPAMPDDQVHYLFANKRPTILDVKPYFERRDFARRTKTPPCDAPGGGVVSKVEFMPL